MEKKLAVCKLFLIFVFVVFPLWSINFLLPFQNINFKCMFIKIKLTVLIITTCIISHIRIGLIAENKNIMQNTGFFQSDVIMTMI